MVTDRMQHKVVYASLSGVQSNAKVAESVRAVLRPRRNLTAPYAEIWYTRFLFADSGFIPTAPVGLLPTHVRIGDVTIPSGSVTVPRVYKTLNAIFHAMQGERWSPHAEGRGIIQAAFGINGMPHTSMSVGDVIVIVVPSDKTWVRQAYRCDSVGWSMIPTESH